MADDGGGGGSVASSPAPPTGEKKDFTIELSNEHGRRIHLTRREGRFSCQLIRNKKQQTDKQTNGHKKRALVWSAAERGGGPQLALSYRQRRAIKPRLLE